LAGNNNTFLLFSKFR